jgi:hypothetical protein
MVVLAVLNSELNHFTKYSYFYIFLSVDCSCIIVLLLKIVIEQNGKYKLRGEDWWRQVDGGQPRHVTMAVDVGIDVNTGMGDNTATSPLLSGTTVGFAIDLPEMLGMVGLADDNRDDIVSMGTQWQW